mgnify:CR=1 FL=1
MMSSDYRAVIAEGLGALQARDMARAASLLRAASEATGATIAAGLDRRRRS